MKTIVLPGRIFYALIFAFSSLFHFSGATIGFAAAHGVPFASILVPFSGVMALFGSLSIALGYKAKFGAWLLVLFLIPVTLAMHNFWAETDPMMKQMQQAMFMKNLGLLGGALLITYFGSGPLSLDAYLARRHENAVTHHHPMAAHSN